MPTRVITSEQFWALVRAPRTARLVSEARAALTHGDKALYDRKKKLLPLMVFIGTFEESEKEVENKKTGEKRMVKGCWRVQSHVCLNGLVVADYDHLEGDVREIWTTAFEKLTDEDKARIVLVYVTPSGHGLKVVFTADTGIGNLIDNQLDFSAKLGLQLDESCKDASRGAFMTTAEDIISINEEKLFTYENKEFSEKYDAEYRAGNSGATKTAAVARKAIEQRSGTVGQVDAQEVVTYHGVPYQKIVAAWLGDKKVEPGDRHRTSLVLADHLRYITDNDPVLIEKILRQTPFVMEIVDERGEDVATTVKSAQGYEFLKGIPKRMQEALRESGALTQGTGPLCSASSAQTDQSPCERSDIYAMLPLISISPLSGTPPFIS